MSIGQTGVLIRGAPGAGKSDLALRLIDRGAILVSDDYCDVAVENGRLVLSAPKTIAGRMEVRGLGIVPVTHQSCVRLGLIVELARGETIERLPEKTTEELQGIKVRWMSVDPTHASADAKVRIAVATGSHDE